MKKITVKAPAKINLTLEVLNKRQDGFHNIHSIMQTISLYDRLTVSIDFSEQTKINLSGSSSEIPYDKTNLVYKAAEKFIEKAGLDKFEINIYIEKNIPVAAGLAGGSTDAAATFYALNRLFNDIFDYNELDELCASLGSDLNFCLHGGCMLCSSRGEVTRRLPFYKLPVSLVKPKCLGISAKEAYTKFSVLEDKTVPGNTQKLVELLENGQFDEKLIYNSLENALFPSYPQLQTVKNSLNGSLMSGSGSTFFILKSKLGVDFNNNDYQIFENLETTGNGVQEDDE